jgi:polysaccharide biosynthesis transport protein
MDEINKPVRADDGYTTMEQRPQRAFPSSFVHHPSFYPQATNSMTARDVLIILRRHVLMIFIFTFIGIAAGLGIWKIQKHYFPKYVAKTYIQVLSPVPTDPLTIGGTQLENNLQYNFRRSIASLIKQQSTLQNLLQRDKIKQTEWFRSKEGSIPKAVKSLERNFVANPQRDSEFVEISMSCGKPSEAALIVNEMLSLFLGMQTVSETKEVTDKLIQLNNQKTDIEREMRVAEENLEKIRKDSGVPDLDISDSRNFQNTITVKLNNLELEKNKLDLSISQFQADMENLEKQATGPVTEQVEVLIEKDPVLISLNQQLALQTAKLSSLLERFGPEHRSVQDVGRIADEISRSRDQRKAEIAEQTRQANLENARDGLKILQGRLKTLEELRLSAQAEQNKLDAARFEYEQVQKTRDERRTMLDSIKEQIGKLQIIATDPETPKVKAVGLAPEPLEMAFSRQWWLWLPVCTMLGLLLGIALSFLSELSNDLVQTSSDVGKYLHIPVLGVIPDASEDNQVRRVNLYEVVRKAPYSFISEAYRQCRANLKLVGPDQVKYLLVCSGMGGDGATSTAVNLAMSFVADDNKVLLIDANFRRPSLSRMFPRQNGVSKKAESFDFGLSSILTRQCTPAEAIRSSGVEGLDIIDCGPTPSNPTELLGSPLMKQTLSKQRRKYKYIIIDGPAVLLVSDSKILAGLSDAVLLVLNAASTSRGAAQRTIQVLRDVNARIAGCVLFAARSLRGGYFEEQFNSYRKYQKNNKITAKLW